ncbi:MAG: extracellular solute-binding protein [Granulosicoccus sp.]|nr:extracellular solute-binding protein [Granulosicoccus sp.]
MNSATRSSLLVLCLSLVSFTAIAECPTEKGSVRILSDDFPALHAVIEEAEGCASDTVSVSSNITAEHKHLQVPALSTDPAEYTVAIVTNGSLVPLLNKGLVQPLNTLVEQYGAELHSNQLITIDGQIMAIAFMVNAQHLFYRKDILQKAGLQVPQTYSDVLSAATKIRELGLMRYPLSGSYKSGWHLAQEFVNLYLGFGGEFFIEGSARPAVKSAAGISALNMMKSLTEFMHPDFLTFDVNSVQASWEAGETALTNLWGSRVGAVLDEKGANAEVIRTTGLAAAPGIIGHTSSASTLWWVGYSLAANISEDDAVASFKAMQHGSSLNTATEHSALATWLVKGAVPGNEGIGVAATAARGAPPYPMQAYMGMMHTAIGAEIVEFLQGKETADQTLADVEAAYRTAATEAGFIAADR